MPGRAYTVEELENPLEPIVLPWEPMQQLIAESYNPGEHMAIVGPNGSGKTVFGLEVCRILGDRYDKDGEPHRVTVLQYKPKDATIAQVIPEWPHLKIRYRNGRPVKLAWPPRYGEEHSVVWPRGGPPSRSSHNERRVFSPLLDKIYLEGKQSVYVPEAAYFERPLPAGLGMKGTMEKFWSTARSSRIEMISDTQRPRMVTNLMWTEPAWVVVYQLDYHEDVKHIAHLVGGDFAYAVHNTLPQLGTHECLVIRRQRHPKVRALYITKVTLETRNTAERTTK